MNGIGGSTQMTIQTKTVTTNQIGEQEAIWHDAQILKGWLDLAAGDAKYTSYYAKVQESTHVFICEYVPISPNIHVENARAMINGEAYDIMLMDNPMGMMDGSQWEIYLKYTGGQ